MFALLVDARLAAKLSDLPLVGDRISPDHDLGITGVKAVIASAALTADQVKALNEQISHLDGTHPRFPEETRGRALVALDYEWGGEKRAPLMFRLAGAKPAEDHENEAPAPKPLNAAPVAGTWAAPTAPDVRAAAAPPAAPGAPAAAWVTLDRSFGPLYLRRLGASYQDEKIWLLCDATVHAGPLELGVDGLGLGIALDGKDFTPSGRLDGLSLSFRKPPLEISGAFVNKPVAADSPYDRLIEGSALIKTPSASFGAIGAYEHLKSGTQSMFLYAELGAAFGGPPAFRVTAVKAGFGYHSSLRVPAVDQVAGFPLLRGLAGAGEGTPPEPLDVLKELTEGTDGAPAWVTPHEGSTWLALGLNADIFEIVHCKALAFAEFGPDDLVVGLLGSAKAQFPDPEKKLGEPYAGVELDISAVYRRSADMLAVDARLAPDSFLLDRSVHLTGGAALRLWFGGSEHPGDFVFTIGGYHPRYAPPAHYPRADPVGVDWTSGSELTVKGTSYFALTPSAVMAGGRLDLRYDSSWAKARIDVGFDALVEWAPFHYEVDVWAEVTAQVWLLFGWSGEASLGARLSVWGPPFGGTAHVKVLGISIPIDFGEPKAGPASIGWERFRTLLPQHPLTLTPVDGLHPDHAAAARRTEPDGSGSGTWTATADGFAFTVGNAFPASTVKVNGVDKTGGDPAEVHIRPMAKTGLDVTLSVTVEEETRDGHWRPLPADRRRDWTVTTQRTPQPAALWGAGKAGDALGADPMVHGLVSGARIAVPAPRLPEAATSSRSGRFDHEPLVPGGVLPLDPGAAPAGVRGEPEEHAGTGALRVGTPEQTALRKAALDALAAAGYALDAAPELDRYAREAAFSSPPLRLAHS
ncbi:hypothetical protein AF335_07495 [Streptomyces eurocidicus]|uniref:DUF6603 domain-containing protein n=1 Tax=Streptomyces eurocidicus TaxID=66423 RepID=A0A2N8P091_STREU|nr:DUF6603 domain-containing protein [Streptomyces eurocidicus]MBB5118980.1 hypothetical protein [Streptomyces eurocidicus]MBF6051213.1 hypothetical protein [Streptomyces eurocidicus]PNE34431.1 hypothetical protein AF335_07495 [Streptomyces eurocidicus]